MENATKALLIAAAVLVAIIIISLTLSIVQQNSDVIADANPSEAEMAQFNQKFTTYEGSNISTAQANTLIETVLSHNAQETNTGDARYVAISYTPKGGKDTSIVTVKNGTATPADNTKLTGTSYYSVKCTKTNGLVTSIKLTAK